MRMCKKQCAASESVFFTTKQVSSAIKGYNNGRMVASASRPVSSSKSTLMLRTYSSIRPHTKIHKLTTFDLTADS